MVTENSVLAAGITGAPLPPAATLVDDRPHYVSVRADTGAAGGHLVLLDSFNADWHATVDGAPAVVQRANVLFRSVHLAPGRHDVEFRYRPAALYAGAAVSALALVGLLLPWGRWRGRAAAAGGFTLIELLIVVAIIAIIAAIAIPGLLRARQSANEASAVGAMRSIHSAQVSFAAVCGGGGYAQSLADLGEPPPGAPFLAEELVSGAHSGYQLVLVAHAAATPVLAAADTCNGADSDTVTDYHASAVPQSVGSSGQRSFATDVRGTIYQAATGAAIANPIPAGTQVLQ